MELRLCLQFQERTISAPRFYRMIKDVFEWPPAERARHYLKLAEEAEQRAANAEGAEKESYEKLAIEWRHLAATVAGPTDIP